MYIYIYIYVYIVRVYIRMMTTRMITKDYKLCVQDPSQSILTTGTPVWMYRKCAHKFHESTKDPPNQQEDSHEL